MKPRSQKHIHKYQRAVIGKNGYVVYKCALPECTHYISEALLEGKLTICWRCGEVCQMKKDTDGNFRHKPHCAACTQPPRNKKFRSKKSTPIAKNLVDVLLGNTKPPK